VFRSRAWSACDGPGVVEHSADVVEDLAHFDTEVHQFEPGRFDIGDHELQSLTEPGAAALTPLPKMIEQAEPRAVSCTTRRPPSPEKSASKHHPTDS
jgi:hypothetical protein